MYGPGRPLSAWNSSAVSSVKAGPLIYSFISRYHYSIKSLGRNYRFGGTSGLLFGDFLDCALNLGDVDLLVVHFDDLTENSPHLEELVFVACDEVELGESHFGCVDRYWLVFGMGWNCEVDSECGNPTALPLTACINPRCWGFMQLVRHKTHPESPKPTL